MLACPVGGVLARPSSAAFAPAISQAAALALALVALSGCSSTKSYDVAAAPARASADIEADGFPAQSNPPLRIRAVVDDPSEPYSRNYGGPNPVAPAGSALPKTANVVPPLAHPAVPDDLPPVFRQKLIAALADD